ncbi:UNVERIFIED_CONTAM: hypothetical protein GTU68_062998 [Idotea baltica]|nr:hypothetical protein [Idotea baltica]
MLDGISLPSAFDADEAGLWLASVALQECKVIEELQYVFCNDSYLIDINQEYLSHDTFTDIITFPYKTDPIQAEIYISLDRVNENALLYNGGNLMLELYRVLVHGLLHMCGYDDSSDVDKKNMRNLEDYYVSMRPGDSF